MFGLGSPACRMDAVNAAEALAARALVLDLRTKTGKRERQVFME
jgi:hypothetical protein